MPLVMPDIPVKPTAQVTSKNSTSNEALQSTRTVDFDRLVGIEFRPFVPLDGLRPDRLSTEMELMIYDLVSRGTSITSASKQVGLTPETLFRWKKKYPEFGVNVEAALAHAKSSAEMRLFQADPEKWLTRGPGGDEEWGERKHISFSVDEPAEQKTLDKMPEHVLLKLADLGRQADQLMAEGVDGETIVEGQYVEVKAEVALSQEIILAAREAAEAED